jgi:DNA-binding CsgD family transcriptional regulator
VVDDVVVRAALDRMLPERLQRLQRVSGVPVVFGGSTRPGAAGQELVLSRLIGTLGSSLRGLAVRPGRGLGGTVLQQGAPCRVNDYASTTTITHDYDSMVVGQERLTSIFAVPVRAHGAVRGVLYGAVRDRNPIGDRAVRNACVAAAQLERELEALPLAPPDAGPVPDPAALAELAAIIRGVPAGDLHDRLARVHRALGGGPLTPPEPDAAPGPALAPRELDVLRLVAVGGSNVEIAAELGLSPQTVKAYLRTAMRKLGVHKRTAAVHVARRQNLL